MEDLRYPIGEPQYLDNLTGSQRSAMIDEFATAPTQLAMAVASLSNEQLETPYRPEGWTLRQVCHHLPDSHSNGYIRTKLTLTEIDPVIKPYEEDLWAKLEDSKLPVAIALTHYAAVQARWTALWRTVEGPQWARTYVHPQYGTKFSLDYVLQLYVWHGKHHMAQITALKSRMNWK